MTDNLSEKARDGQWQELVERHFARAQAAEAQVEALRKALEPFRPAYAAYVAAMQGFTVTGSTEAERRFSEGERHDTAMELAFEALSKVTLFDLAAVEAALSAPAEERRTTSVAGLPAHACEQAATETQSPAGLDREFAEELYDRLQLVADDNSMKTRRTNFRGEIVTMRHLVLLAARMLGRPLASSTPESSAKPVAWSLVFSEVCGVNADTTFKTREQAEGYASRCSSPPPRVVPLYAAASAIDPTAPTVLDVAWININVLGAPDTACRTPEDLAYCRGIGDALAEIEKLGGQVA